MSESSKVQPHHLGRGAYLSARREFTCQALRSMAPCYRSSPNYVSIKAFRSNRKRCSVNSVSFAEASILGHRR
jgi:hypothetical protein